MAASKAKEPGNGEFCGLADYAAGYAAPPLPPTMTIGAILDGYLADRRGHVASMATLEAAAKALRRHLGDLSPENLTRERSRHYAELRREEGHLVGPANERRRKPTSDGTIARELVTLRAALRWAVGERWIAAEPAVVVPSAAPPRDRWLTPEEARRLVESCQAAHVRLFVLLALHTAARSRAILDLTWAQVDLRAGRIDLGRSVGRKGRAVVPINAALLPELLAAQEGATGAHVIETAGGAAVGSIKTGFRAACRRAGLADVTPHTLRHTAATWMALARVPMRDIALLLGHRDTATTERIYAKHHPDFLVSASSALAVALPGHLARKPSLKKRNEKPVSA